MKKFFLIVLIAVFLLSVGSYYINNNLALIVESLSKDYGIKRGDLVYQVNIFGFLPAAEAVLSLEDIQQYQGQDVYHLNVAASSYKFYSGLFKGSAILDSFVDKNTLNPVLFRQKVISSGSEPPNKEVFYDQKNMIMTIGGVQRQILPNTHDPLSAIFNIRKMNLDNIQELEMNINTNQKNYILKANLVNKDMQLGRKQYRIILVQSTIRRRDKNPYHQSKLDMVLLQSGQENIPVLIKVFASGFLITAKLSQIR